jgi:opacity protein-like surface antigen
MMRELKGRQEMNKVASYILAIIIVLTVSAAVFAQADKPKNEIEVRATVSVPSGEANFNGTTASGDTIDFNRDMQYSNEWGFDIKYAYRSEDGKNKFGFEYGSTDWDRTRVIGRAFTFRGQTYVVGAAIEGNLRQSVIKGMYARRWGNEKVRIGPMIDFGVVPTHLDITGTTLSGSSQKAEGSISKFAATIGYDLDWDPTDKISVFNNLGGIAFQHDRLFHAEGGLKYYFSHNFGALAGYKYQRYRWVNDDNFLRISSHGPFVGGVIRF